MMLDSSLSKILKTKPVEPSIPSDDRLSPSKDDDAAGTSKPEAEVRLVVRFFVEEHIVFNGKIEKIRQLESEEVSRVVSRIAWDGSRSCDSLPIEVDQLPTGAIDETPSSHNDLASSNEISNVHHANLNPPRDDTGKHEMGEATDSSAPALDYNITTNKSSPVTNVPLHSIETIVAQKEVRDEGCFIIDQTCDTNVSDHHLSDLEQKPVVNTNEKINLEIPLPESSTLELVRAKHKAEPINEMLEIMSPSPSVHQSVLDVLNGCVERIEIEFTKPSQSSPSKVEYISNSQTVGDAIDIEKDTRQIKQDFSQNHEQHNINTYRHLDKSDKRPLMEAANFPLQIEVETIDPSGMQHEKRFSDLKIRSDQLIFENEDISLKRVPIERPENINPIRRRNTADSEPASKRIRRTNSKDLRKLSSTDRRLKKEDEDKASAISQMNHTLLTKHSKNLLAVPNLSSPEVNQNSYFVKSSKIFAKWTDNHFYPGTILRPSKDRKFTIGFFDGAQRNVAETDLIPLCNILGKQVRVALTGDYCVNAIVHDKKHPTTDAAPMFDVEYQQDGIIRRCVPLKDIFLTAEQGIPLINQLIRPEKNPDESMFAGVDLDNIVHVKRSRRLQEMEESDFTEETTNNSPSAPTSRRKRNQYNMRHTNNRRAQSTNPDSISSNVPVRANRKSFTDVNLDTPASSCSPDGNNKAIINGPNSNPPSESNSSVSTGSSNSTNVLELGQEFYFDSSSPHRTKTSLLL